MILAQGEEGLFIMKQGHVGVGILNLRQVPVGVEAWSMDFLVGHVAEGTSLDLAGDVMPPTMKQRTALVEDVPWKMGLEEVGAQLLTLCLVLVVEDPSYQRVPCGPIMELATQGHAEGGT